MITLIDKDCGGLVFLAVLDYKDIAVQCFDKVVLTEFGVVKVDEILIMVI